MQNISHPVGSPMMPVSVGPQHPLSPPAAPHPMTSQPLSPQPQSNMSGALCEYSMVVIL